MGVGHRRAHSHLGFLSPRNKTQAAFCGTPGIVKSLLDVEYTPIPASEGLGPADTDN